MPAPSSRAFKLDVPDSVARALADPRNESPKPGDAAFATAQFKLIARPADAFHAAQQGCVRPATMRHARRPHRGRGARCRRRSRRPGLGAATAGPPRRDPVRRRIDRDHARQRPWRTNQEYALALAIALDGAPGIAALAGDTDGTDGGAGAADDPAGALIDATTLQRARWRWPRSGPFSCRQQFDGLFQPARRPGGNRTHVDQRERFSRYRR